MSTALPEGSHSKWSPSSFEALAKCPGKRSMETGLLGTSSIYAVEGTVAHAVLTQCLQNPASTPEDAIGAVYAHDGFSIEVDEDMARHVQTAIDYTRNLKPDVLMVDQRVDFSSDIGVAENEGTGTADIIMVKGNELIVPDFKYGHDPVHAENNKQCMLYALGALNAVCLAYDIDTVRIVILQPRVYSEANEWPISAADLRAWASGEAMDIVRQTELAEIRRPEMVERVWQDVYLSPNAVSCKYCKAKATCEAYRREMTDIMVEGTVATADEFEVAPLRELNVADAPSHWLAAVMRKEAMIEGWLKGIRAEVERRLSNNEKVPGFKMVMGRSGRRRWDDTNAVIEELKKSRLKDDDIFNKVLKTPTQLEKLAPAFDENGKPKPLKPGEGEPLIPARKWKILQARITQSAGAPHVAPEDDKRPAIAVSADPSEFA